MNILKKIAIGSLCALAFFAAIIGVFGGVTVLCIYLFGMPWALIPLLIITSIFCGVMMAFEDS